MQRNPESTEPRASGKHRTTPGEPARRRARSWLWAALGVALAFGGWLLPGDVGERSATDGAPEPRAASLFGSIQQWMGLGTPSKRSRDGAAGDEPLASVNALRVTNESTHSSATGAATGEGADRASRAQGAAVVAGATLGAEPAGGAPAGDDTPRDARVTGRVLDATGGPIGGAQVRVHFDGAVRARQQRSGRIMVTPAPDAEWTTDAEGRFEGLVPTGGVSLAASAEAYAEVYKRARAPAHDVTIVLAPASRVSGRVQRGDGSPVSGASLQIKPRAMDRLPLEGTSDERGEFSIGGVPAGVVEVTASAAGLSAAHEWLHLSLAETSAPVVLTLNAAHSVYGVVREPDGAPCSTGIVRAGGRWQQTANVDAQGTYRLDGLDDGTHELSALCLGVGTRTQAITFGADSPPSIEVNWQLEAGFTVTGNVHRKSGEPVEGAMIWLQGVPPPDGTKAPKEDVYAGLTGASCSTDAAGEFSCEAQRAGWYRVHTSSRGGADAASDPVRADERSRPRVELVLPDMGQVRVRVTGPVATSGDGLNGLSSRGVFARGESPMPIPAVPSDDGFVFEGLALGRYRVALGRAPSELGPSAADIELTAPDQVIELELRAPDPLDIGGTVVDAAGEPLPDAWVAVALVEPGLSIPFPVADPVLTNSEGRFQLTELPPGRYALRASHPSGEGEVLDVAAGQRDVRLVAQGYGSLSGSVTTADGQPARDFSVLIFRETPAAPLEVDGERGRWSMRWVTPGDYQITIMSPSGGVSTSARVTSGKETTLAQRLDPELAGQAVFKSLKPR